MYIHMPIVMITTIRMGKVWNAKWVSGKFVAKSTKIHLILVESSSTLNPNTTSHTDDAVGLSFKH